MKIENIVTLSLLLDILSSVQYLWNKPGSPGVSTDSPSQSLLNIVFLREEKGNLVQSLLLK